MSFKIYIKLFFILQVYDRLQPLGISLSHQGMLDTTSSISGTINAKLIDSLKSRKEFRIVGDNINFKMGVAQERKSVGKVGQIHHWFGSAAIIQNIKLEGLDNTSPQCDVRLLPLEKFMLCETEWQDITYNFSMLMSRVLVDFFGWLKPISTVLKKPIADVPEGLKEKNMVIPLPILHKNEQKYTDVIDILDSYQEVCESVHVASNKELKTIHIGGDQLTRERFSGAKKLRAAAFTEKERLESLNPITFEIFHLQMAVLTMFFHILYNESHTDVFTVHCQKLRLLRKDANGLDVKNNYDSCKELAISVIKSFIVQSALEFYDLPCANSRPECVPDFQHMSDDEKQDWIVSEFTPLVNQFTSTSRNFFNGTYVEDSNPDIIYSYSSVLIELGLIFLELCDIVKSPNRKRLITCLKYLMLFLKGHNSKSKYALEILRFLCQQYALLSEKDANAAVYGLFVNTGSTIIPADLQMEYLVRVTKKHLRSMCSNVTDKSLIKRSSAFFGMNEISEVFDKQTSVIKRAQKHKRLSSSEDEHKILSDLKTIKPFTKIPGRQAKSFKKQVQNPITKLSLVDLHKWIQKYQKKYFFEV